MAYNPSNPNAKSLLFYGVDATKNKFDSDSTLTYENGKINVSGIVVANNQGLSSTGYANALTIDASGNVTISENLTVNGSVTTLDTTNLVVEDPLIILGSNNASGDSVDLGFYGKYSDDSGSTQEYAGLFRDASDEKFRLFHSLTDAPDTTINTSGTGYTVATLVANLEGTATSWANSVTLNLGDELSGSVTFDGATASISLDASLTSAAITGLATASGVDAANDYFMIYDDSEGALRKMNRSTFVSGLGAMSSFDVTDGTTTVTVDNGETITFASGTGAELVLTSVGGEPTFTINSVDSEIVHDNLSGFVANEHIDHSGVSIVAGSGLAGGGNITQSRTLNIGQGDGITVSADSIALASTVAGSGLNYSAGVLNIGAGTGISVDGTSVGLANTTVTAGSYGSASSVGTFTVDAQGRLTTAASTSIQITSSQVTNFGTDVESAVFTSGNFVDSTTIDFTVTSGASVTATVQGNSISETHLTASVAGSGLAGGNGTALSVNVGDALTIAGDTVDVLYDDDTVKVDGNNKLYVARNAYLSVSDYTTGASITHDVALVTTGSNSFTLRLPAGSAALNGKVIKIKKIDNGSGVVTVAGSVANSEGVDGSSGSTKTLYYANESISVVYYHSDTTWYVI